MIIHNYHTQAIFHYLDYDKDQTEMSHFVKFKEKII